MNDARLAGFRKILSEIEYLRYTLNSVLYWDKITYMPKKGFGYRNEVTSYIGEMLYKLLSSEELQSFVRYYDKKDNDQVLDATLRRIHEVQQPITNIPQDKYKEYLQLVALTEKAWNEARLEEDFGKIMVYYEQIFIDFRQFAEYWGYEEDPYDALMKQYVEGYTTKEVDEMVESLRKPLLDILKKRLEIQSKSHPKKLLQNISKEEQIELWKLILREIGFDFDAGRLDLGAYTTILANSPDDVRIVNEYSDDDFLVGVFNILHSGGKAIYHQNIEKALQGTLLAEPPCFVMEEAIGRFYENVIGKSRGFWERILPQAKELIPAFIEVEIEEFYESINYCQPSCIRINADEITSLIHIIIRYEIEKEIIRGDTKVCDLEDVWMAKYKKHLNVKPKNLKEGVLQDVHWATGYIGYFPTYILASVAATQFTFAIEKMYGNLDNLVAKEGIGKINQWMQHNIFRWGAIYDFKDLITKASGEELNVEHYLLYLEKKFL